MGTPAAMPAPGRQGPRPDPAYEARKDPADPVTAETGTARYLVSDPPEVVTRCGVALDEASESGVITPSRALGAPDQPAREGRQS